MHSSHPAAGLSGWLLHSIWARGHSHTWLGPGARLAALWLWRGKRSLACLSTGVWRTGSLSQVPYREARYRGPRVFLIPGLPGLPQNGQDPARRGFLWDAWSWRERLRADSTLLQDDRRGPDLLEDSTWGKILTPGEWSAGEPAERENGYEAGEERALGRRPPQLREKLGAGSCGVASGKLRLSTQSLRGQESICLVPAPFGQGSFHGVTPP